MTTIQCPECSTWCFHPLYRLEKDVAEDFICPDCRCEFTIKIEYFITKHGFKLELK